MQAELAKRKAELAARPPAETEEQRIAQMDRQALEESDRALIRRLNVLEYLVHVAQSICRVKPIGRDRFCNRYFWFDGNFGALSLDTVAKIRDVPEQQDPFIPNDFAYGCLFVEEFSTSAGPGPQDAFQADSDLRQNALLGKWGYYSSVEQVVYDFT